MAKHELNEPTPSDKRFQQRKGDGIFDESDDVGISLSADQRAKAKTNKPRGEGDKGTRPSGLLLLGKPLYLDRQIFPLGPTRRDLNRIFLLPFSPGHRAFRGVDDCVVDAHTSVISAFRARVAGALKALEPAAVTFGLDAEGKVESVSLVAVFSWNYRDLQFTLKAKSAKPTQ